MHIGYLVHNLNDPAVERRCAMLERGGAKVKLAGFCRDAQLSDAIAQRRPRRLRSSRSPLVIDLQGKPCTLSQIETVILVGGI